MFHDKYPSSSALGFLKGDILSFFLMATRFLHGIKFFEQFLKVTTKGKFRCNWLSGL
jgi:hypothetical protein